MRRSKHSFPKLAPLTIDLLYPRCGCTQQFCQSCCMLDRQLLPGGLRRALDCTYVAVQIALQPGCTPASGAARCSPAPQPRFVCIRDRLPTVVVLPTAVRMQLPPQAAGAACRQNSRSHRSVGTSMLAKAADGPGAASGASPPRPRPVCACAAGSSATRAANASCHRAMVSLCLACSLRLASERAAASFEGSGSRVLQDRLGTLIDGERKMDGRLPLLVLPGHSSVIPPSFYKLAQISAPANCCSIAFPPRLPSNRARSPNPIDTSRRRTSLHHSCVIFLCAVQPGNLRHASSVQSCNLCNRGNVHIHRAPLERWLAAGDATLLAAPLRRPSCPWRRRRLCTVAASAGAAVVLPLPVGAAAAPCWLLLTPAPPNALPRCDAIDPAARPHSPINKCRWLLGQTLSLCNRELLNLRCHRQKPMHSTGSWAVVARQTGPKITC